MIIRIMAWNEQSELVGALNIFIKLLHSSSTENFISPPFSGTLNSYSFLKMFSFETKWHFIVNENKPHPYIELNRVLMKCKDFSKDNNTFFKIWDVKYLENKDLPYYVQSPIIHIWFNDTTQMLLSCYSVWTPELFRYGTLG